MYMQKNKNVHTNGGTAATARKPIKIPHVYVIICAIILFVAVCTWFVPPGQFDTQTVEVEGVSRTLVIPGTFHTLEEKHPAGLVTILSSLHRGLVSGAEVTMLIFLVNGAFSMVLKTGAFNAFLGSLLRRFSSRAKLVIPVFFLTFAVLSSTFGMWNEYNGLIPVFMGLGVALGYDALAGFAILELGKGIGWSAATLNPFSVPVSQGIAGVPIFSGMGIRVVSFVIFSTLGIAYIFYYGQKVSKNPSKSLILGDKLDINFNREEIINTKTTKKQMWILLEILVSAVLVLLDQLLNLLRGRKGGADGAVMVHGVDDSGQVFAHVGFQIPLSVNQFLGAVIQVGGDDIIQISLMVVLVKFLKAVGKETEGAADDDLVSLVFL